VTASGKPACKPSLRTSELKELKRNIRSEQAWKHPDTCDASKTGFFSTPGSHGILIALRPRGTFFEKRSAGEWIPVFASMAPSAKAKLRNIVMGQKANESSRCQNMYEVLVTSVKSRRAGRPGTYGFPFPSLPFMWWRTACIMRTWTAGFSGSRRRTSSKSWYRSPFGLDSSPDSVFIRAPGLDPVYAMSSIMKANCTRCRSVGKMLGSWTQW